METRNLLGNLDTASGTQNTLDITIDGAKEKKYILINL
jgi:hypothetical protein